MIGTLVRSVWPESDPVAYESTFNGKLYATSWIQLRGETAPGVYTFESQLQLDPRVLGQGGSLVHAISELEVDENLRPLRYVTQARGATLRLKWVADVVEITLPDGSQQKVPVGESTAVLESHFAGLDALILAHRFRTGQLGESTRLFFFFVNQLTVLPYQITAAPELGTEDGGQWYRTSFQEELLLDGTGQLVRSRNRLQGVETRRLAEAPARPQITAAPSGYRPAIYIPPADAQFRSVNCAIPGPVTPLGATLTVPNAAGAAGTGPQRWPAVLFLSGSGTHDRNGIVGELDIGVHEIVDGLANAGFVGLRYDTRGAGTTQLGSDHLEAGLGTIIADALAAYQFLAARPEVDPERIFLLGHSQGGTVALALATRHGVRARGIALLATVGRSLEELSLDQLATHGRHTGLSAEQLAKQLNLTKELYALIRAGKEFKAGEVPDIHLVAQRSIPWMREWLAHQADEMIGKLTCPVFIANGEKDFQVSAEKDAQRLYEAAKCAGVPAVIQIYPLLDHLFKPTLAESTLSSYYEGQRHVDPAFRSDLTKWLQSQASVREKSTP